MLVLSRKVGEEILIGEDVVVRVVEIDRGKVKLAIQAPKEVSVYRDELVEQQVKESVHRASRGG